MKQTIGCLAGLLVVLSFGGGSQAADQWGLSAGDAELQSATVLAFGPEDILFVGDAKAAAIVAIATGDKAGDAGAAAINIDDVGQVLADELKAKAVILNDLAVNPRTGTAFLAATADGKAVIATIDGGGKVGVLSMTGVRHSRVQLADAPEDKVVGEGRRARNNRGESITDLAFFENKILVSGLSNADAPSSVRELNFPFAEADSGIAVEIYHAAHGRSEDYAAMRTFVPLMIGGEPTILGAYVCTPLVKIPVAELSAAGERVKATTVAELGNRNRPLDMISYSKGGAEYLLLSNSARGVMKIGTSGLRTAAGLTERVSGGGTAGHGYETVESMTGVVQLDKLNSESALVVLQAEEGGPLNLRTVALP